MCWISYLLEWIHSPQIIINKINSIIRKFHDICSLWEKHINKGKYFPENHILEAPSPKPYHIYI